MLIFNEKLSVCPITTHIDINEISKKLKKSILLKKSKLLISGIKIKLKRDRNLGF